MVKVKQPLLSFDARRRLGDEIVYSRRRGANIVESKPYPADRRSPGQLSWRTMFLKVVALWHALSATEKEAWESLARPRHMTGYAWFVSQALRPNPGIYLPLQGGTMSGEIDMAGHSITELPAPTGAKHATRRSYVIARVAADILTHKGDASAHHARYADGEALAAAIAGGLSKVVWKDVPAQVVASLNRVGTLAWTDLDLTATTSANAKFAYLNLLVGIDSYTSGAVYLGIRKNGTTPTWFPICRGRVNASAGDWADAFLIQALDAGQVMEHTLVITGTAQADFYIRVLGYIE